VPLRRAGRKVYHHQTAVLPQAPAPSQEIPAAQVVRPAAALAKAPLAGFEYIVADGLEQQVVELPQALPAGLRSQTPMNQTASKPWKAI